MVNSIDQTQITTSLPYCLYRIDNRSFNLEDEYSSTIKFTKVETIPNRRTQFSQNVEVIRDRWGIDAHSDVEIHTNKLFDDNGKAEIFALNVINDFIRRYRYFDKDAVHLMPLTHEDLFGLNVIANGHGVLSMSFAGGMTIVMPQRNKEISDKVEQSILKKEDIPLWEELLLNAEQYLFETEYRHSVLESIIALELVISEFIRKRCNEKDISKEETKSYIKNVGLTGNIKVTLSLLLSELPSEEVIKKCKASITIRNKIVHEGKKDISRLDAQNSLSYTKMLIQFLLKYL